MKSHDFYRDGLIVVNLFLQKEETVNWLQIWCITWVSWIWHSHVPDIWSIQVHDRHVCNIIRVWISWLAGCNSNHNNNTSLLIYFTLFTDAVSAADKHISRCSVYLTLLPPVWSRLRQEYALSALRVRKLNLRDWRIVLILWRIKVGLKVCELKGNRRRLLYDCLEELCFRTVMEGGFHDNDAVLSSNWEGGWIWTFRDPTPNPLPPLSNELLLIAFVTVWGGREMFNLQTWCRSVISGGICTLTFS